MRRSAAAMIAGLAVFVGAVATGAHAEPQEEAHCTPSPNMPVEDRLSPYDSTSFVLAGERALVCYGRPSLRGRQAIGGTLVPYGRLWRTGANEPTILHLPVAATVAGIPVEAGSYSLYTIPGPTDWVVIVNRSTSQWGHERQYTDEVRSREAGRRLVSAESRSEPLETFTITASAQGENAATLVLEWDRARISIPIVARP